MNYRSKEGRHLQAFLKIFELVKKIAIPLRYTLIYRLRKQDGMIYFQSIAWWLEQLIIKFILLWFLFRLLLLLFSSLVMLLHRSYWKNIEEKSIKTRYLPFLIRRLRFWVKNFFKNRKIFSLSGTSLGVQESFNKKRTMENLINVIFEISVFYWLSFNSFRNFAVSGFPLLAT